VYINLIIAKVKKVIMDTVEAVDKARKPSFIFLVVGEVVAVPHRAGANVTSVETRIAHAPTAEHAMKKFREHFASLDQSGGTYKITWIKVTKAL